MSENHPPRIAEGVAACLSAVAAALLPVVVAAVAEALKDPETQAKLGEAGALLFRPRDGRGGAVDGAE